MLISINEYDGSPIPRGKLFELLLTGFTYISDTSPFTHSHRNNLPISEMFKEAMNRKLPGYDPYFAPGRKHHPVLEKFFSTVKRRFRGQHDDLSLFVSIGSYLSFHCHTDLFFYWRGVILTIDLTTCPQDVGYKINNNGHIIIAPKDIGLISQFENISMLDVCDFTKISFDIKDRIKYINGHSITNRQKYKRWIVASRGVVSNFVCG